MWSTVLLSTGLALVIGCATSTVLLIRKQLRQGTTGFGMLAASDSVLSSFVGTALVGLALFKEESQENRACSKNISIISASTFLLSFVNSFISVLLMAIECWIMAGNRVQDTHNARKNQRFARGSRLTIGMITQWLLPALSIAILYSLTPDNVINIVSRQASPNNTCQLVEMFPASVTTECLRGATTERENEVTNNLTMSVVQRIYELINGSISHMNPTEAVSYNPQSQPQTKEEWKDVFMQFQRENPLGHVGRNGRQTLSNDSYLVSCNETCRLAYKMLDTYFVGVVLIIYVIPTLGAALLHRQAKIKSMPNKGRSVEEEQETNVKDDKQSNVCHLNKIKMMVISNFVMWTPTVIERLFKKWLCNSSPQWLEAILFIVGQINTIIRGLITANVNKPIQNVIVPLKSEDQSNELELSSHSADNIKTLFQKRMK